MIPENTKKSLTTFAKQVVSRSRANLTRTKKNVSKDLYNSVSYELQVHANSYSLRFLMEDYADFQDKGVGGTDSSPSGLGNAWKGYGKPAKYKASSNLLGFELATGTFAKWAKFRGIRFRNESGQFAKGGYKSIGVAIALAKKKKGIKPSLFFSKPLNAAFKTLPQEIIEAFGLDLTNIITDKNE